MTPAGLRRVVARRYLYATGAYDQNLPFADNDRPGIVSARACGRLAFHHGVRPVPPGKRVLVLAASEATGAAAMVDALAAAGIDAELVSISASGNGAAQPRVVGVRGAQAVRAVEIESAAERRGRASCGRSRRGRRFAGAGVGAGAPARSRGRVRSGARRLRGGRRCELPRRARREVFACGDVTGFAGADAAAQRRRSGWSRYRRRSGREAAREGRRLRERRVRRDARSRCAGCRDRDRRRLRGAAARRRAETPPAAPARPADAAVVEPPAFVPAPVAATPEARDDARRTERRAILDAAWKLVRDKHYDKTLGGVDWTAVRARYEPLALAAPSDAAFYRTLNQMIGELGQSHMMIAGPGAEDDDEEPGDSAPGPGGAADPGVTVRVIENRPTITRVRPGSPAERAGLLPGFIVTHIGGRELRVQSPSQRPLRPVEERFAVRRRAQHRLMGPAGTKVSLRYLDNGDRPGEALLEREQPEAAPVELGHLPPLYPEVRADMRGDVGILAFNIFLLQPVMADIKRAMDGFRARHARALIIDLRGNPGGQGAMAIPIAAQLVSEPLTLGTLKFRDFNQVLHRQPRPARGARSPARSRS